MRRDSETEIGGRYTRRRVVLTPGAEQSATGVSLTALTEHVHPDGAIPPEPNFFLLMSCFSLIAVPASSTHSLVTVVSLST